MKHRATRKYMCWRWLAFLALLLSSIGQGFAFSQGNNSVGSDLWVSPRGQSFQFFQIDLVYGQDVYRLAVERVHDSRSGFSGPFGRGWFFGYAKQLSALTEELMVIQETAGSIFFSKSAGEEVLRAATGDVLQRTAEGGFRHTRRADESQEIFDAQGRLLRLIDRNKNMTMLVYESSRLTRITGPNGKSLTLHYGKNELISAIEAPSGATAQYEYDNQGHLTRVANAYGLTLSYAYDANERLTRVRSSIGSNLEIAYTAEGRVAKIASSDGAVEQYRYDPAQNTVFIADALGRTMAVQSISNAAGRRETVIDSLKYKIISQFDSQGRLTELTQPDGQSIKYTYDSMGRITVIENPGGVRLMLDYEGSSARVARSVDSLGAETLYKYDTQGNLLQEHGSLSYQFDYGYYPNGLLKSLTDAQGHATTYSYDEQGHLLASTDAIGGTTRWQYDERDRMTQVTTPDGAVTKFVYDNAGQLTKMIDALGAQTTLAYDTVGRLIEHHLPDGKVTRYQYDSSGQLISTSDSHGYEEKYAYDRVGNLRQITDSAGRAREFYYDALNRPVQEIHPQGYKIGYAYDPMDRLAEFRDPLGRVARYTYDALGNIQRILPSLGSPIVSERAQEGGRTILTETQGNAKTKSIFDTLGRLIQMVDAYDHITEFKYDSLGNLSEFINPSGHSTQYSYDALGRHTRVVGPDGNASQFRYDAMGRLIALTDPLGATVGSAYDLLGHLTEETDSLGNKTRWQYDSQSHLMQSIDANGHSVRFEYEMERLNKLVDPRGQATRYVYDMLGNLTRVRDAKNSEIQYEYDAAGRILEETDALGDITRYQYDAAGNLVQKTNGQGQTVRYFYVLNRLVRKEFPDGVKLSFSYDDRGNLIQEEGLGYRASYEYDALDRLVKVKNETLQIELTYEYDAAGNLVALRDSLGHLTRYSYDAAQRLVRLIDAQGKETQFTYDAAGRLTQMVLPNGVTTRYQYDAAGHPLSVQNVTSSSVAISSFQYQYDPAGNVTRFSEENADKTEYHYDEADQLTSAQSTQNYWEYRYDAVGNRLNSSSNGNSLSYQHDAANQLMGVGDISFKHDKAGRLIEKSSTAGVTKYEYDAEDHLIKITESNGKTIEYGYSPTGYRIWKKDTSGKTFYLYSGEDIILELDQQRNVTAQFAHGPGIDRPLSVTLPDKGSFYYSFDGLGNVTELTSSAQSVVNRYRYDPYGSPLVAQTTVYNPYTFTSLRFDADAKLMYARARYYDPALGRFLTRDTVRGNPLQPLSFNSYLYAFNNPITFSDAFGYAPQIIWKNGQPYYVFFRGITNPNEVLSPAARQGGLMNSANVAASEVGSHGMESVMNQHQFTQQGRLPVSGKLSPFVSLTETASTARTFAPGGEVLEVHIPVKNVQPAGTPGDFPRMGTVVTPTRQPFNETEYLLPHKVPDSAIANRFPAGGKGPWTPGWTPTGTTPSGGSGGPPGPGTTSSGGTGTAPGGGASTVGKVVKGVGGTLAVIGTAITFEQAGEKEMNDEIKQAVREGRQPRILVPFVRALGRGIATTAWELTSIPSAWRTGEFIGELINAKPTLTRERQNEANAAAIQQALIKQSQQIMGSLEAEKNRILGLVNQANTALGKLEQAMNQAIDHENKARELLKSLKPKGGTTALQNPSERAKSLKQKVQDQINKIKQESHGVPDLAKQIKDAADQVCSLVDLIEREKDPKSREDMLNAAKQHAATAQNANTQVQKIGNAVKTALGEAKSANEELKQIIEALEKASKAQDTLKETVEQLKNEAHQAEAAFQTAQTQAADLLKYAEQARTAAQGFSRRVNAMIDVAALNVGQLIIMKTTVEKALGTLRDDLANHHAEEAKTSAKNATASATQGEKLLADASMNSKDTDTPTPADDLLNEAASEALHGAFDINEAEGEAKRAQRCIDRVLKPGTKTTLHGYIFDSKSNKPISGATASASGNISVSVPSGGAGTFTLTGIDLGTVVNINVSAKGYRGRFKSVKVVDEDPLVNFALEPGKGSGSAKLTGTVVDKETGKPITGAIVSVEGQTATTGVGGSFSIGGLPDDTLVPIKAEAKGYSASSRGVKLTKAETTPITIALWPEIKELNLTWVPANPALNQSVNVTASVFPRRAGVPIRVSVSGTDKFYKSQVLTTDANGQVFFFVPGAQTKGTTDTLTAEVVGRPFKKTDSYPFKG